MVKPVVPVPVTAEEAPASKPKRNSRRKKANPPEPKLETMLWAAVDKLRGHINAAEYKHHVLGLIFLRISDAFEEHRKHLEQQISDPASEPCIDKSLDRYATLEDRAEYTAASNFWVPQEARCSELFEANSN
jgi:type I restriction enzyme M protein